MILAVSIPKLQFQITTLSSNTMKRNETGKRRKGDAKILMPTISAKATGEDNLRELSPIVLREIDGITPSDRILQFAIQLVFFVANFNLVLFNETIFRPDFVHKYRLLLAWPVDTSPCL
jgi:hypothetical protein